MAPARALIMGGQNDNLRGAGLMTLAMVGFTVNDAFMKGLAGDMGVAQGLFLRGILVSLALGMICAARGELGRPLVPKDRALVALRSVAEVFAAYFFVTAVFNMEIANATAIIATLPLTISLAGAIFLGEPIGWRRLAAILVGGVGVLLIVQPGTDEFTIYSVYAIAAVLLVTVRDLAVRRMSASVPSSKVAFFTALSVMAGSGLIALTDDWVALDLRSGSLITAAAAFVLVAYLCSVAAMRSGELGFVAPFRYTSLLAALIIGLVVFKEWPSNLTLLGAAIVVGTGIFTLWREHSARQT